MKNLTELLKNNQSKVEGSRNREVEKASLALSATRIAYALAAPLVGTALITSGYFDSFYAEYGLQAHFINLAAFGALPLMVLCKGLTREK